MVLFSSSLKSDTPLAAVKFVTSYEEEDIGEMVAHILKHILCPKMPIQWTTGDASIQLKWV